MLDFEALLKNPDAPTVSCQNFAHTLFVCLLIGHVGCGFILKWFCMNRITQESEFTNNIWLLPDCCIMVVKSVQKPFAFVSFVYIDLCSKLHGVIEKANHIQHR